MHGAAIAIVRGDELLFERTFTKLDSVLIDQNRRLAIVDGGLAGVGDRIGSRVIVAINRDGILREPSGLEVRVSLRLAVGRPD